MTTANETGGKYESGRVASLKVYPATKKGFTVLTFDFIMLARAEFSAS